LDRTDVSELADASIRNYTDVSPGPTDLRYTNVDFAFDDQLILNDVTVTRYDDNIGPDPVPQTVTDAASISTYFTKSGQRTGILVQTDQEASDQAHTLVAARKDSQIRIDSMSLNLLDGTEFETLVNVSMDIYTLINITKTMAGGSTISRELFVQGVQHDVRPGIWNTKLLTAEPIIQAFILDSPNQGILALTDPPNTNALSY
jgi:Fe-S cluster assembly iron-binding protein IscA